MPAPGTGINLARADCDGADSHSTYGARGPLTSVGTDLAAAWLWAKPG